MPDDEDEELVIYISPDSTRAAWAYIGIPFSGSFMGRFPLQTREEDTRHMVFVQANQWLSAVSAREQSRGEHCFHRRLQSRCLCASIYRLRSLSDTSALPQGVACLLRIHGYLRSSRRIIRSFADEIFPGRTDITKLLELDMYLDPESSN